MKKLIILLIIIPISSFAFTNEPDGFRNIKWGDEFSQYADNMSLREDGKDIKFYTRNDDSLKIGGAELDEIVYGFRDNKFGYVIMKTTGISNKSALIDAFKSQFGRPFKPNRYIDNYIWNGSIAKITVDCKTLSNDCSVFIQSSVMYNEKREQEKEAADNSSKDF